MKHFCKKLKLREVVGDNYICVSYENEANQYHNYNGPAVIFYINVNGRKGEKVEERFFICGEWVKSTEDDIKPAIIYNSSNYNFKSGMAWVVQRNNYWWKDIYFYNNEWRFKY